MQLRWSCWKVIALTASPDFSRTNFYESLIKEIDPESNQFKMIDKDIQRTLMNDAFFIQNATCLGKD